MPDTAAQLLLIVAFAGLITLPHGQIYYSKIALPVAPFTFIWLTLAILLDFLNSTSYSRPWTGGSL